MSLEGWTRKLKDFAKSDNTVGLRLIAPQEFAEDAAAAAQAVRRTAAPAILGASVVLSPAQAKEFSAHTAQAGVEQVERTTGQLALDSLVADVQHADAPEAHGIISGAELACLEKNIYNEARGEIDEGQLAVAFVTIARAMSRQYPNSICGVVYQSKQFSWTFDRKILSPRPIDGERALHIRKLLKESVEGRRLDEAATLLSMMLNLPTDTLYYKRTDWDESKMSKKTASYFAKLRPVRAIGNHTFYADR